VASHLAGKQKRRMTQLHPLASFDCQHRAAQLQFRRDVSRRRALVRARSKVKVQYIQSGRSWPPFNLQSFYRWLLAGASSKWELDPCAKV
jgi:hypothetical protein